MNYAPHSVLAEQSILGLLMFDRKLFELIDGRVFAEDFYVQMYGAAFDVMLSQYKRGMTPCPASILAEMAGSAFAEDANVQMPQIFNATQMGGDIQTFVRVVKDLSYKRKMASYAKMIVDAAEANNTEACNKLQGEVAQLSQGITSILPDDPVEQIQRAFKAAGEPEKFIRTCIEPWDRAFGGIMRGSRYIIAGRAGSGKTALSLNIGWNVAKQGFKVRHIFFEGTVEEIWFRIMARETNTPITSFRKGLTQHQQANIARHQEALFANNFAVVRDPRDVGEMIDRCGRCDVIVLDGISSAPAPNAENIIDRVQTVTSYCKTLADKTGAAVIMLAHLNSEGVKNAGSGTGIYGGQAATFDPESILELKVDEETKAAKVKLIEGHITKNRYGENGMIKFMFDGEHMRYDAF